MTMTDQYRSSGQSVEQSLEFAKRSKTEFNVALTDAASAVVRYAANLRPISDPQTLLAMISATFETTALDIIQRIDQNGRVHGLQIPTQQTQAELQAWRRVALSSSTSRQSGQRQRSRQRNRSPNPQFTMP